MSERSTRLWILVLLFPLLSGFDPFRSSNRNVERGNAQMSAGKPKEALEHYQRAAKELPDEPGVHYNLGVAQFRLGQLDKARESLLKATSAGDRGLKARSFYNLGSVQLEQKRYKEAVSSLTRALQLDPGHRSSKWNLELALRRQQEEEKKKKKDQKKDQNKDQKKDQKKDQNKDQKQDQKQDQKKDQQKDQKQDSKKQQRDKQDQKKEQPKPEPEKKRSPEMDRVLDALDQNDKNLQRQRGRQVGRGLPRPSKDW